MEPLQLSWMITQKDSSTTIKDFLKQEGISRRALSAIKFKTGKISVNGIEKNVLYELMENDLLAVTFPAEKHNPHLKGEDIPLSILYEDRDILVINKPPFMNTIPSREHPEGSLANALVHYYEKQKIQAAIHIVTRLDRNTSGAVLVAKHRHAHHLLSLMQREQKIGKFYEAFIEGKFLSNEGSIEAPIARKKDSIIEREVRKDGQYALTHYKTIKIYEDFSRMEIQLITGRTHQIRVHFAHIGHPLVGDDLYGGKTNMISRQALHCKKLALNHPFTKEKLLISASLPADMQEIISLF